ncbi:hypothetical protein C9X02_17865 [Salmonella enterica subsp. enterica serovar Enteritidis]|nr:hypothetical protein [Salmonella enterica subsp. enterica serovar Enteritidis]EGW9206053.1 hypothetical protein [Salmonella enterica subsp. enterica serovar Enteritidis]
MNELSGLHPRINELDEYELYLLTALLKKAAADAGKRLTPGERQTIVAGFFSRQADHKTLACNRRRAVMSRKMSDIRVQEQRDFQWKPSRPRR